MPVVIKKRLTEVVRKRGLSLLAQGCPVVVDAGQDKSKVKGFVVRRVLKEKENNSEVYEVQLCGGSGTREHFRRQELIVGTV